MRKRRRVSNLLDNIGTHRQSHLRLFVTHHETDKSSAASNQGDAETPEKQQQQQHKWTLVIEGKLLVGHLDHQSVDNVEKEAREKALMMHGESTAPTTAAASSHESSSYSSELLTRSTDRTGYRGKPEEGELDVEPIEFTHFFDKMTVQLQTIYQPIIKQPPKASPTPTKKSRSKKSQQPPPVPVVDETSLVRSPSVSALTWIRPPSQGEARRFYDPTAATTNQDAHAFMIPYETPLPPDPSKQQVHSVVAKIDLYPRTGGEQLYLCSQQLSDALFRQHSPTPPPVKKPKKKSKKQQRRRSSPTAMQQHDETQDDEPPIPLDNDMFVPPTIAMREVCMGLFHYIQHHDLCDSNEPSVIECDDTLQSLFGCERLNFCNVQQLLFQKQLLTDANTRPVSLTYVMSENTVSTTLQQQEHPAPEAQDPNMIPSMLSVDIDVSVASLFPNRARELMRRIKRREFEYTNSRTRARNLLMRAHDDTCRQKIDDCVVNRGYGSSSYIPVWLALAKGAPPMSEARAAMQIDAKTCALLQELEHRTRAAKAAWDVVEACRGAGGTAKEDDAEET
jgi:hypothetical protein